MTRTGFSLFTKWLLTITVTIMLACDASAADLEKTIFRFHGSDGAWPRAGLIADAAGNLYGTTMLGGSACGTAEKKSNGCGTVFELTPTNGGRAWTETVLYAFKGGKDGGQPQGSLVFDAAGDLYGTTSYGGATNQGAVFQLSPPAQQGGAWTEAVIYSFSSYNDGFFPVSLIIDQQGNLYGEEPGYPDTYGDVFELSPPAVQGVDLQCALHV
jgi:uncharacterized repeat protein (TIGR03803 family)